MVNKIQHNSLINPKRFLTDFYNKVATYPKGPKAFLKARDNKKDLEIWAVSIVLIGLNKLTNKCWWIEVPKEDPPDAFSVRCKIEQESNSIIEEYVPIEVVFVPKYVKQQKWNSLLSDEQNIYNFLNDKKFNLKLYEQGTHLIVYFNEILSNVVYGQLGGDPFFFQPVDKFHSFNNISQALRTMQPYPSFLSTLT